MPRFTPILALFAVAITTPIHAADPATAEIVLRAGTIYDGTGKPGYIGDVHVKGDRIIAVGKVANIPGAKEIDAKGFVICPGFIDLHSHCDIGAPPLTDKSGRTNKNYITQGCTTVVTGNCGSGPVSAKEFFNKLESGGVATNVIHQAPHNSIRLAVMGNENRAPTPAEQEKMEALVEQAMRDGCVGLATGLIYNPGTYAKTGEIIGLAKVSAKHGGIYASHIRDEGGGLLDAIAEAIQIGKESGCPVHISHIKAMGKSTWGKSIDAVGLIDTARKTGQVVTADQYPYIASSTSLRATVVPSKYREGGQKEFVARLDDTTIGPKLRADIAAALEGRAGGARIRIAKYAPKPDWQGKSLTQIATDEKRDVLDIVLEIERAGGASVVNFGMNDEDVRVYMKQPWVATASDGSTQTPGDTVPHPRSYGTFPRKIARYAIADGVITLEQAIRSSSGLPADILKLKDRGYLKPGSFADLVVFDPKTYLDTATYEKPHQYASGVQWVFVNGQAVIANGVHQPDILPGQVIRFGNPRK